MHCTYIRPDGEPCKTSQVVDPTGANEDFCAFHVPLKEKESWEKDARDKFANLFLPLPPPEDFAIFYSNKTVLFIAHT